MKKFFKNISSTIITVFIVIVGFLGTLLVLNVNIETLSFSNLSNLLFIKTKTPDIINESVIVESISESKYAYNQLTSEEQQTYDQLLNCIINFDKNITVATKDSNTLDKCYNSVMSDYGNIFWINGYSYNTYKTKNKIIGLTFTPTYTMKKETKDDYQIRIDQICDEWLNQIDSTASDYEKAIYVYEKLIKNVDYNLNSEDSQNILSVFLNKSTVCQGYSAAAQYMLEKLNIPSTIIYGVSNGENHAWNLLKLDGDYYYMDVTWGNSQYRDAEKKLSKRINYSYFGMTSEDLKKTHIIDTSFDVPECTAIKNNYFVHNELYFEDFSANTIGNKIKEYRDSGKPEVSIKLKDLALVDEVIEYFFTAKHIKTYCKELKSIYYLVDENSNVITIQW